MHGHVPLREGDEAGAAGGRGACRAAVEKLVHHLRGGGTGGKGGCGGEGVGYLGRDKEQDEAQEEAQEGVRDADGCAVGVGFTGGVARYPSPR